MRSFNAPLAQAQANRWIWVSIILFMVGDLAWIQWEGLSLSVPFAPVFVYILLMCGAVSLIQRFFYRDESLFLFGDVVAQLILVSFVIDVSSYLGARLNFPLVDGSLAASDMAIDFGLQRFLLWIDDQPLWVAKFLTFAYGSFGAQAVILVPALFIRKQSAWAQRLMIMLCVTGAITVVIATLFPALYGYIYHSMGAHQFAHLHPAAGRMHEPLVFELRNRASNIITYPQVGIVTLPSYHAVMAVMLIYISLPFLCLRLVFIPLNIVMIFSCITDGGHYMVDIIAGLALALLGIAVAEKILPRVPISN